MNMTSGDAMVVAAAQFALITVEYSTPEQALDAAEASIPKLDMMEIGPMSGIVFTRHVIEALREIVEP